MEFNIEHFKPTDDPRRHAWLRYFREIADLYGLRDWTIEIDNHPPGDRSANASVACTVGRKFAWMRISQWFIEDTAEAQRMMVVHELTHCHLTMEFEMGKDHVPEDQKGIYTNLMEYGIDGIATAIAKFFPLPSEEIRGVS